MIEQIAKLLRVTPFAPFSVTTTSGETLRVPHPDYAHVGPKRTTVTIYDDNDLASFLTALHIVNVTTTREASDGLAE